MFSDLMSLERGIVKTSRNKENPQYTVLLVGETGVGKSSLVNFIATTLVGESIGLDILEGAVSHQGLAAPHLHEITSNNGVLVSANVFEYGVKA